MAYLLIFENDSPALLRGFKSFSFRSIIPIQSGFVKHL